MPYKALINFAHKRTLRRLWDDVPTVDAMRKTMLDADRLGAIGRKRVAVDRDVVGGVPVEWVGPRARARDGVILHLHGGGFVVRAALADRRFCARLARRAGRPVAMVPYRLAPEFPFPAGLDDCCAAYRGLLEAGIPAARIVVTGHSAGANLALALVKRARREGLPQPAGAVLLSGPIDLTASSPSAVTHAERDCMMGPAAWPFTERHYLRGTPADHPDASPMFGAWDGLAPLHFHVSDQEILLDDSRRGFALAREAGNAARLAVWPDVPHSFYYLDLLPEARRCRAEIGGFIGAVLSS